MERGDEKVTNELIIRPLQPEDAQKITDAEVAQGWHQTIDKYLMRLDHAAQGKCTALVAELAGEPVGYINVYPSSQWGPPALRGNTEIVDFGVLEKVRNRGIGTALMDAAEAIARQHGSLVYLGVGLHSGYGAAQRMYVKRGYLPDGKGAWYHDQEAAPYESYPLDDDLCLYLTKQL